jgi:hypothetical protein
VRISEALRASYAVWSSRVSGLSVELATIAASSRSLAPGPSIRTSTVFMRTGSPGSMRSRTIQFGSSRDVRLRTRGA